MRRPHPVARVDGLGRDGARDEVAHVPGERRDAEPARRVGRVGPLVKDPRRRRVPAFMPAEEPDRGCTLCTDSSLCPKGVYTAFRGQLPFGLGRCQ